MVSMETLKSVNKTVKTLPILNNDLVVLRLVWTYRMG